jgi:hypothetical protein
VMLACGFGILIFGVFGQKLIWRLKPDSHENHGSAVVSLAQVFPALPSGWRQQDVPLGPTEPVRTLVMEMLGYSSYIFRRYEGAGISFDLYCVHWAKGKVPVRLVQSHTPDRCWSAAGWYCSEMRFQRTLEIGGRHTLPVEERSFIAPSGEQIFVWFCHIVEGRVYDNGRRFGLWPSPSIFWRDLISELRTGNPEQYFIRVSSKNSLSQLLSEPFTRDMLKSFSAFGFIENSARIEPVDSL